MRALILAAGLGTRLKALTADRPKCLVEVNGKTILDWQLEALRSSRSVKDIVIVGGKHSDRIADHVDPIVATVVKNDSWSVSNNAWSIVTAAPWLIDVETDVLVLNGDVIFEPRVADILHEVNGSVIAVDQRSFKADSMKVIVDEDGLVTDIGKTIDAEDSVGSSMDIYKIDHVYFEAFLNACFECCVDDMNCWAEVALERFSDRNTLRPSFIKDAVWSEIDTEEDLRKAERIWLNP